MFKKGEEINPAVQSLLFSYGGVTINDPSWEVILHIGTQSFRRIFSDRDFCDYQSALEAQGYKIQGYWPESNARVEINHLDSKQVFVAARDIGPFEVIECILKNKGLKVAEDMYLKDAFPDFYQAHIILRKPVSRVVELQL